MNYTKKGEWEIRKQGITYEIYSGKYLVAEGILNKTNAQIVVASPALYEACKLALKFFVAYDIENKVISGLSLQLNEAIAKGKGMK